MKSFSDELPTPDKYVSVGAFEELKKCQIDFVAKTRKALWYLAGMDLLLAVLVLIAINTK